MEKINWTVNGMTCANCALSVNKTLTKQGMEQVAVNPVTGDVSFTAPAGNSNIVKARKHIELLGYKVEEEHDHSDHDHEHTHDDGHGHDHGSRYMLRFWVSLPFTLLLMSHMIPGLHIHWLMNHWVQFGLALPVFIIGMEYFGKSAIRSIMSGILNMDVLVALGALAAFGYSTWGLFTDRPQDFLFFETAASIITIVFLGNFLEDWSVQKTQREIKKLSKRQVVMANMIAYDSEGAENIFPVKNTALKVGDLVLVKTGEQVPMDCKILWGEAEVNEAIITGESIPVFKKQHETLIGGSTIVNGSVKGYITATGKDTVMSAIVELMKKAQTEKPPVQQLADKISAIFVPAVLIIALVTLLANMFIGNHTFQESLMRAVAVLVIACPCAMGLATPAAIAVGLGRAAKHGILFTDVTRMELFRNVQQMVFDKTGTLTTGKFNISNYHYSNISEADFKSTVYSLEKFSNHPIAKSISEAWKTKEVLRWQQVEEIKGKGMKATDKAGDVFTIGSQQWAPAGSEAGHHLYIKKNDVLLGWIDIADEIRPEAATIIQFCKARNIKTILLSGDSYAKCKTLAAALGIDEVVAEQTPEQKLAYVEKASAANTTVMVGDGVNDAPALAKATISVSLAEASQLAIQSASVVLTSGGLSNLPLAMLLGKYTFKTVKSNLFWAFAYNIVAIPVAALGFLHPTMGALIMGASDGVLALNSLWLRVRKLK